MLRYTPVQVREFVHTKLGTRFAFWVFVIFNFMQERVQWSENTLLGIHAHPFGIL